MFILDRCREGDETRQPREQKSQRGRKAKHNVPHRLKTIYVDVDGTLETLRIQQSYIVRLTFHRGTRAHITDREPSCGESP